MKMFVKNRLRDEGGMALVTVLMVMLLMAILGTTLFSSSSTGIKISRNKSFKARAFYAAERANEYAGSDPAIYASIGTGVVAVPASGVSLASNGTDASGRVEYLSTGNPPRGSGVEITEFRANYFLVDVTGTGPAGALASIESGLAKIIPND